MKLKLLTIFYLLRYSLRRLPASREALDVWQERRIGKFVKQMAQRAPFYAAKVAQYGDWRAFPPINKALFMEHFNEINTCGIDREQAMEVAMNAESGRDFSPTLNGITVGLSTGTSGNRGLFLASTKERAQWVAAIFLKVLKPWRWRRQVKVAFFLRANSNLYNAVESKVVQFQFYDLLRPVSALLADLALFQPDVIVAQPSMLLLVAGAVEAKTLRIQPGRIISVAEVLDPETEARLTQIFQQQIHQVYQCTEGFLACTCDEGTLHVNEDFVKIEPHWIDEEKTRFQPIITDFTRTSQPVIRYLLNDVLVARQTPCPCGSPFMALERIEGRMDDVFLLLDRQGREQPVFADFIRRAVVRASEGILEYQVIQTSYSKLLVQVELSAERNLELVNKAIFSSFEQMVKELDISPISLEIVEGIPPLGANKLRRIRRDFTLDNASQNDT